MRTEQYYRKRMRQIDDAGFDSFSLRLGASQFAEDMHTVCAVTIVRMCCISMIFEILMYGLLLNSS